MSFAMFCFFFVCMLLESAGYLQKRMAPCKAGVETSCREVHLGKASYAVILSLGRIAWMNRRAPCVADYFHLLFEPKASDSAH